MWANEQWIAKQLMIDEKNFNTSSEKDDIVDWIFFYIEMQCTRSKQLYHFF